MPTLLVPNNIKFDEAISLTQTFLSKLKKDEFTSAQILTFVSELVQTANGARGFFVTYLTAEDSMCDTPHPEIIAALQAHPEIAADLLVKNLAMSSAQQLYHHRRNDIEMTRSSATVSTRTTTIIRQLNLPQIQDMCRDLLNTISTGVGSYSDFLIRWGYDEEQKNVIARSITQLLSI